MELLYLWECKVRATSKAILVKLPCGFLGARGPLPYIPTKVIGVMGHKCITFQLSASGAAVLPGPKRGARKRLLLATATHPPQQAHPGCSAPWSCCHLPSPGVRSPRGFCSSCAKYQGAAAEDIKWMMFSALEQITTALCSTWMKAKLIFSWNNKETLTTCVVFTLLMCMVLATIKQFCPIIKKNCWEMQCSKFALALFFLLFLKLDHY